MKLLMSMLMIQSLLAFQPSLASIKFVSLCEVALMKKTYYGKTIYTVGTFASIPRHYFYLYDEKCPEFRFLIRTTTNTHDEVVEKFKEDIRETKSKIKSTKHILEFKGTLEKTSRQDKFLGNYDGVFVVSEMLRAEKIQ